MSQKTHSKSGHVVSCDDVFDRMRGVVLAAFEVTRFNDGLGFPLQGISLTKHTRNTTKYIPLTVDNVLQFIT